MKNNAYYLLTKLIDRTKQGTITWQRCSQTDIALKGSYKSPLEESLHNPLANSFCPSIDNEHSYVASYNEGYFFLVVYRSSFTNNKIELRVQTKKSQYSSIYASSVETTETNNDINVPSQLKRLYNLIDDSTSNEAIDSFVNSFINDL